MPPALTPMIEKLIAYSIPEPNSGCWLWIGHLDRLGYGQVGAGKAKFSTHRASYSTFVGQIPDGLCVCHRCDWPKEYEG
jgi:hypothetical protein